MTIPIPHHRILLIWLFIAFLKESDAAAPSAAPSAAPLATPVSKAKPVPAPSTKPSTAPSNVNALTCKAGYTLVADGCFRYSVDSLSYVNAQLQCELETGWLARLNTPARLQVTTVLGVQEDTYFGLYKTAECSYPGCAGKLQWSTCANCPIMTGGELLNMAK
jgi:hypothetical protein